MDETFPKFIIKKKSIPALKSRLERITEAAHDLTIELLFKNSVSFNPRNRNMIRRMLTASCSMRDSGERFVRNVGDRWPPPVADELQRSVDDEIAQISSMLKRLKTVMGGHRHKNDEFVKMNMVTARNISSSVAFAAHELQSRVLDLVEDVERRKKKC